MSCRRRTRSAPPRRPSEPACLRIGEQQRVVDQRVHLLIRTGAGASGPKTPPALIHETDERCLRSGLPDWSDSVAGAEQAASASAEIPAIRMGCGVTFSDTSLYQ